MLLKDKVDSKQDMIYQLSVVRATMTSAHVNLIRAWPSVLSETISSQKLVFIHGSLDDPTFGYVYPDTELDSFTSDADWVFMGNTHHPFIRGNNGTHFINVGSCGMPRDDGRYGSVALIDIDSKNAKILRYNIEGDTDALLQRYPNVDTAVKKIFERRSTTMIGEIL
jgi:predicted phosphodiesterase